MDVPVWETFTNNKQWETYLKNLLRHSDVALLRATIVVWNNQTADEKYRGECIEDNKIGFDKYDVSLLSPIALKISRKEPISRDDMYLLRSRLPKYWRQLMAASKRKLAAKRVREAQELLEREIHQMEISELPQMRTEPADAVALRRCREDGIACDYGICSECPNMCNN